jgi:hypothetical protein
MKVEFLTGILPELFEWTLAFVYVQVLLALERLSR